MKRTLLLLALLACAGCLSGCTSLVPVTRELARSQSTFRIDLTSPVYGSLRVTRIGQTNATITFDPQGNVTISPPKP